MLAVQSSRMNNERNEIQPFQEPHNESWEQSLNKDNRNGSPEERKEKQPYEQSRGRNNPIDPLEIRTKNDQHTATANNQNKFTQVQCPNCGITLKVLSTCTTTQCTQCKEKIGNSLVSH